MIWICFYLLVSLMFTGLYHQMTTEWTGEEYAAFISMSNNHGFSTALFPFRVLIPLLGRLAAYLVPLGWAWIFRGFTAIFTFLALVVYRRYLSNFMRADFASVFSLALIYPMIWNLGLLNRLFFPFDVPSVMFFILGCDLIYRRSWRAYYIVLALATLNRETSFMLIAVFLLVMWGDLGKRALAKHLMAQVFLWIVVKGLIYAAVGPDQRVFSPVRLQVNYQCLRDIALLRNNGPKDLVKFALCCGGVYWFIPLVLPGQPRFLKRSLIAVIPFIGVIAVMGILDEIRSFLEMIPLVLTPLVYRVAAGLGGAIPPGSRAENL